MVEYWFCFGIMVFIGLIVVGLATFLRKLIITLFSRELDM